MARWRERRYPVEIVRHLDAAALTAIDPDVLAEGDDAGYLAGNAMFQDLSGYDWADAKTAVDAEHRLIERLKAALDLETEAEAIEDERLGGFDDAESLWGLDVGVIGAVIALSALGAAPVASCNAGGFGGHHQASHPYVAFYLPAGRSAQVLGLAEAAGVGLMVDDDGLVRLFTDDDLGLPRFGALAVERHAGDS